MADYEWRWYPGFDVTAKTKKEALKDARSVWRGSHYGRTPGMKAEKLGAGRYRVFARIKQKNPSRARSVSRNPRAGVKLPRTGHTGFLKAKAVDVITRGGRVVEVRVKR